MAARHGGPIPLLSFLLGFGLVFPFIWFQGRLGLAAPLGDGGNLTEVAPLYFGPWMLRWISGLIAIGMTGWFGYNVGLGSAALSALVQVPQWIAALILGLPIVALSLRGIKGWNGLAAVTTGSVLVLVAVVVSRLGAHSFPLTLGVDDIFLIVADMAAVMGYLAVFILRTPDFTAGLTSHRDLNIVGLLLCVPLALILLTGANLAQGTGTDDLVGVLARPGGWAIGNLLITLAVIAPTFTTLFSGVPALRAATGLNERVAIFVVGGIGVALAVARFDLWLLSWLGLLAAVLPPIVIPLAFESTVRRRHPGGHRIPMWVWLAGAATCLALTLARQPLALLAGLVVSGIATIIWQARARLRPGNK
jgi:cytosine permease